MRLGTTLLLLVLALAPACAAADKQKEILLSFSGLLKSVSQKQIIIEPEPDNDMTFVRTKRTRFVLNGRKTDARHVTKGSIVTVDSVQKLNGDLEAVTVTVTDAAQGPSE